MDKIFVSYGRKDLAQVQQIVRELDDLGVDFWMDTRNLKSGDFWTQEITRGIKACTGFLLFMSGNSMSSDNVRREVQLAFDLKKRILLMRLDDAPTPEGLQFLLSGIQWIEFTNKEWKAQLSLSLGKALSHEMIDGPLDQQAGTDGGSISISDASKKHLDAKQHDWPQGRSTVNSNTDFFSDAQKKTYYEMFLTKHDYLASFEVKINQSFSNSTPLIKANDEFNELAMLAGKIRSELKSLPDKENLSDSDLARVGELAKSIANQAHAAATTIVTGGTATKQINQIKQNLPTLHRLVQQLMAGLQK